MCQKKAKCINECQWLQSWTTMCDSQQQTIANLIGTMVIGSYVLTPVLYYIALLCSTSIII